MRLLLTLTVVLLTACAIVQPRNEVFILPSPGGRLQAQVQLQEGVPHYRVVYGQQEVLEWSRLGLQLGEVNLAQGLVLAEHSPVTTVEDRYTLSHGKRRENRYQAQEQVFDLTDNAGNRLSIRFRVSDDGVAFRYEMPGETPEPVTVEDELTSFHFPDDARAWLQPIAVAQTGWSNTNPSYEEHYEMDIPVGQASPSEAGWVFPALFQSRGVWVAITEAGMNGEYHASRLQAHSPGGEYVIGFPMAAEVMPGGALKAQARLPFHSPWRIIAVGNLATLTHSSLGTDLAEPAISPMPFAKPGLASWSWALLKDDSVNFETQKAFIDYAADMGWPYTLVDAEWDTRIGGEKVQELAAYAATKNVGLLLWYNSAGTWNVTPQTPKHLLLHPATRREEFAKLQRWGIRGIKVDFFAGDGQSMMAYYNAIARDAADFGLLLNYHGASLPRGLARTYPNMMTMEAVHGFEMITFNQKSADLAASHVAMLPFTRNLFDPMDFTPTTFGEIPDRQRRTTNGFELALPVLLLSGLQHIAETPEGMAAVPAYVQHIMRTVPVSWDESRLIRGAPGKEVVIARRAGNIWYVAGVNGEPHPKDWQLDLSFIQPANGVIVGDKAPKGDAVKVKPNIPPFIFTKAPITAAADTAVHIQGNGGFLMVFGDEDLPN
jgi:hypothetical protein